MFSKSDKFFIDTSFFGAVDLNPNQTNLDVIVWSMHEGNKYVCDSSTALVKIGTFQDFVIVTAESKPKTVVSNVVPLDQEFLDNIHRGIEFVGHNYDVFAKHYFDHDCKFDDEDLLRTLESRGQYRFLF